ncbi:hypothetical protein BLNAU_9795 [Blattamonas nauphoetae]|uniref:Uncharacterized protein n=1 Tax=Blattamonas nauphoetae TaxID=2049346 RepID=A0ABQ9XUT4_9EUKA|nr:hypothetical protein BLNAU_9795 [Blattamonas nauphoetae]
MERALRKLNYDEVVLIAVAFWKEMREERIRVERMEHREREREKERKQREAGGNETKRSGGSQHGQSSRRDQMPTSRIERSFEQEQPSKRTSGTEREDWSEGELAFRRRIEREVREEMMRERNDVEKDEATRRRMERVKREDERRAEERSREFDEREERRKRWENASRLEEEEKKLVSDKTTKQHRSTERATNQTHKPSSTTTRTDPTHIPFNPHSNLLSTSSRPQTVSSIEPPLFSAVHPSDISSDPTQSQDRLVTTSRTSHLLSTHPHRVKTEWKEDEKGKRVSSNANPTNTKQRGMTMSELDVSHKSRSTATKTARSTIPSRGTARTHGSSSRPGKPLVQNQSLKRKTSKGRKRSVGRRLKGGRGSGGGLISASLSHSTSRSPSVGRNMREVERVHDGNLEASGMGLETVYSVDVDSYRGEA